MSVIVIREDFSHVERALFPLCRKISPFLCIPFLIADQCQQPVLGGSEDSTGDKSGAVSQVLIVLLLH